MKTKKIESTETVKDRTFSQSEDHDLSNLAKIIILLREQTGHDFSFYKESVLLSRIEKRLDICKIDNIQNYVRFLQEKPNEVMIFFKALLIGVTSFFRDAAVWKTLEEKVIPALINELPDGYVLRAWVPGCSTGEEAYSLAILFNEALESFPTSKNLTLQIFATDLNSEAIEKARQGFFSKNISTQVSQDRLSRFFKPEGGGYRVNMDIRKMVMFASHNVTKDAPFTRLDLLSCRNLLIYMETELQQKLITLFNYSLNPNGILVLGSSESLGSKSDLFNEVDAKLNIFKRNSNIAKPERIETLIPKYYPQPLLTEDRTTYKGFDNIRTLTEQILLERFTPASVLVNDNGDILYVTGNTEKYLEPIEGKVNRNIHAMAREGLREALPGAFHKALLSFDAVTVRNINVRTNGGTQRIDVTVQHIEEPESLKGMLMVVFTDVALMIEDDSENPKTKKQRSTEHVKDLEIQLQQVVEELQRIREEMQTSQEELKSTNEKLQSINEKQQKTNEKLNTSKEETQSLNEELLRINIELKGKVSDDLKANDDMKNLLNNTGIATLFLDKELNIRMFSNQVTKIFKLRNSDIGRPFTDLVTDLQYNEIGDDARLVLKTLLLVDATVATHDGRWFAIKIMPYRTLDNHFDGLVMTFTDITVTKMLEIELKEANEAFHLNKENHYSITHLNQENSKTIQN